MNREEMLTRAAEALAPSVGAGTHEERFAGASFVAGIILDAILPQVTTMDQVWDLPAGSVVVDEQGIMWDTWELRGGPAQYIRASSKGSSNLGDSFPLTVVWQPS